MVPIIEMAENPTHIPEPLYLYEPSDRKRQTDRAYRDSIIARILDKRSCATTKMSADDTG